MSGQVPELPELQGGHGWSILCLTKPTLMIDGDSARPGLSSEVIPSPVDSGRRRFLHAHTHAHTRTLTHTDWRHAGPRDVVPQSYHVIQEVGEPVRPVAQAAEVLQPLGSDHPVPHHGARDGRRQDGEPQHDAERNATLADALQAADKTEQRVRWHTKDTGLLSLGNNRRREEEPRKPPWGADDGQHMLTSLF